MTTKDDIKQLKDDIAVLDSKIDILAQGSQEDVKSMIRRSTGLIRLIYQQSFVRTGDRYPVTKKA